ncbi:hypothetical protein [Shewanella algae]|uniref:hypothetical protein n=1 Tax=Shewanella algae TaxID=38313 RepID=UPI0031F58958
MSLDHGLLNIPLKKRGDIDAQIDKYKAKQAKKTWEKHKAMSLEFETKKAIAIEAFVNLEDAHIKVYAVRANITLAAARKELKSMALWSPSKAVKLFSAIKEIAN